MEAARPVASPERDAFLKDIAAGLGQHESDRTRPAPSDHQRSAGSLPRLELTEKENRFVLPPRRGRTSYEAARNDLGAISRRGGQPGFYFSPQKTPNPKPPPPLARVRVLP